MFITGYYRTLFLLKSALTCAKPLVYCTISDDVIHSIFKEDVLQPETMKDHFKQTAAISLC